MTIWACLFFYFFFVVAFFYFLACFVSYIKNIRELSWLSNIVGYTIDINMLWGVFDGGEDSLT